MKHIYVNFKVKYLACTNHTWHQKPGGLASRVGATYPCLLFDAGKTRTTEAGYQQRADEASQAGHKQTVLTQGSKQVQRGKENQPRDKATKELTRSIKQHSPR